jgi:nucleoid DNA-binding protein
MNGRITYTDLLEYMAEKTGAPKRQVLELMRGIVEVIRYGLERDGRVVIRGLGRFELRWQETRLGRNPRTGEELEIRAHSRVHFRPESALRRFINRNYGHLEPKMISDKRAVASVEPETTSAPEPQLQESFVEEDFEKRKRSTRWLWVIPVVVVVILLIFSWWKFKSLSERSATTETASRTAGALLPAEDKSEVSSEESTTIAVSGIPGVDHGIHPGDRLWSLSDQYYGNVYLWPYIFRANGDSISNPDMLVVGKMIFIPPLEGRPGNLSSSDRINIADGYMRVYLAYRRMGKPMVYTYLWVARQTGSRAIWDTYRDRIDEKDMAQAELKKGRAKIR